MDHNAEKAELIQKLKIQDEGIKNILDLKGYSLLTSDVMSELSKMREETQTILRKLKKNEFEIAVVGLEKAGKSSFCNALIENNFLPTNEKRCTYTSTKITYSDDSKVTVKFYSKAEFERDFQDKLAKLGIENANTYSVSSLTEAQYLELYEDVSSEKKALYDATINVELLDIIRCKSDLLRCLDSDPEIFTGADVDSQRCKDYITEPGKAMAVREAIFDSPILNKMPNAVIYDVPGFNSPTEMHRIQTKNRMDSADAIILVAAADAPSITGDLLKIFKENDGDGTILADKLFVFANKADRSNKLTENIQITYHDWIEKYKIMSDKNRFFFGSSNAQLQSLDKLGADEKDVDYITSMKNSFAKLDGDFSQIKEFGSAENGFGVVAMRKALEKYNDNERFKVIKTRTGILREKLFKMLSELMEKCAPLDSDHFTEGITAEIMLFQKRFIDNVTRNLNDYRFNLKDKIVKEKPLSIKLLDYVNEYVEPEKYSDIIKEKLEEAKRELNVVAVDSLGAMGIEKIEGKVRNKIFDEMYVKDFSGATRNIVSEHHAQSRDEILDRFMQALEVEKGSKNYQKIRDDLAKELQSYLDLNNAANHYQSLIERYSRDIFELLIEESYTNSRYARFLPDISTYFSMSVYYDPTVEPLETSNLTSVLNDTLKNNVFCYQMLCHDYANSKIEETRLKAEETIKSRFNIKDLPTGEIPELILKLVRKDAAGAIATIANIVEQIIEKNNSDDEMNRNFYIKEGLKDALGRDRKSLLDVNIADENEFTAIYQTYFNPLRKYDDMIQDLNDDIVILKDALLHCIIRALSLEKPYIAKEYIIIDNIIEHLSSEEFANFIGRHFKLIISAKYDELESARLENERNAVCRKEIDKIMSAMRNITE